MRMNYCRKIFGTHLRYCGIESEMVNLLEGRTSPEIFVRHYWSPNMKQDIERVRKAIDSLADQLIWHPMLLISHICCFFLLFHYIIFPSFVLLPYEQWNYKANKKRCSNRLLFPVHGVLVALKFCPVGKCTIAYTAFVRRFFSLLVNLFLRFPFLCHVWIGIYYLI